jgi:hypothetical protein
MRFIYCFMCVCVFVCSWESGFNDPVRPGRFCGNKQLHELVEKDVTRSIAVANKMSVKLHQATPEHIGLVLMHQFVVDLLGRDTSAARIFIQKVISCVLNYNQST